MKSWAAAAIYDSLLPNYIAVVAISTLNRAATVTYDSRLPKLPARKIPKDLASMFLTIKYQKNPDTLKRILHSIPGFHAVEKETFDAV